MGGAVEFEWDPAKAETNLRKHGVPFLKACEVFKDPQRLEQSDPYEGEERWIALGRVEHSILVVVFTERENKTRIISARKATRDEEKIYRLGHISS
jgi:uncharacterized protein